MTVVTGDSKFSVSKWIVSPNISDGATHTTFAAAMTAASAGDNIFIKPGTYAATALKAGVSVYSFQSNGDNGLVRIVGNNTFSADSGIVVISGVQLVTDGGPFLTSSGTGPTTVVLQNCYLTCSDATGISYTNSNSGSFIRVYECQGDLLTTGIAYHSMSSAGELRYFSSDLFNTGLSTTASTNSAGTVGVENTDMVSPLSNSGSASFLDFDNSTVDCSATNTIPLVVASTAAIGCRISNLSLSSGTNSCLSISASALVLAANLSVTSSNANVITGAGTLQVSSVNFLGSSTGQNITTITPKEFGITGSFTPTMTGSSSPGTTTYLAQNGNYHVVGKRVFIDLFVSWSAADGTGDMRIGGLPFTVTSETNQNPISPCLIETIVIPASTTYVTAVANNNTTYYTLAAAGDNVAVGNVQVDAAGNVRISGSYYVD